MKDILIEGHRILTTDEIATAVIDYARALLERGAVDVIEFPSFHDGVPALCSLLLGCSGTLAIVDAPLAMSATVGGADLARDEITRKMNALR